MDYRQLVFSFVAISVLALVARWLFPVRARLNDERVTRNFARCYPDLTQGQALIADDGAAALLPLASDRAALGLVIQFGDRVVCRLLTQADIAGVERKADRLRIRFNDFTYPDVEYIASGDAQENAYKILKTLDVKAFENAA